MRTRTRTESRCPDEWRMEVRSRGRQLPATAGRAPEPSPYDRLVSRTDSVPQPLRILYVCTANIARSPFAERLAAQRLTGFPTIEVGSAGIPGYPGRPMDADMAEVLHEEYGVSAVDHISRTLTWEMVALSDIVLTFEFGQHMLILDAWPDHAGKVLGFHQFADVAGRLYKPGTGPNLIAQAVAAAKPNGMTLDVSDPYRRGMAASRACAAEIDAVLDRILPVITGQQAADS